MAKKVTLESIAEQIVSLRVSVATQIEKTAKRVDDGFKKADQGFKKAEENFLVLSDAIAELRGRTASLEDSQEQILEKLEPLSRAHDKDAVTIVRHDEHITRLEQRAHR